MTREIKRQGFWWQTMGFTRTHVVGVFTVQTLLCLIGTVLAVSAIEAQQELAVRILLGAICLFLLEIAVLLGSILSLLFYLGSSVQMESDEKPKELADRIA